MSSNAAEESGPDCVIAIPCFQESARLPEFLRALCDELHGWPGQVRIQVVDDGSGPAEVQRLSNTVAALSERYGDLLLPPLLLPVNVGKGGAVYAGWRHALALSPRSLALVDADGSVPAGEVRRLLETFEEREGTARDAIFASRLKILGRRVDRQFHRHLLGRVFATAVTAFTGMEVYDSQCGLKILQAAAFQACEGQLEERGFVFDVELALVLLKRGFEVREFPIDWQEVPGSKVHLLRDSLGMLRGLRRIRSRHGRLDLAAVQKAGREPRR